MILDSVETTSEAQSDTGALSTQVGFGQLSESDFLALGQPDSRAVNSTLGVPVVVDNTASITDGGNQLGGRVEDLTPEQIERMLTSAVNGVHNNQINDDLKALLTRAVQAGPAALQLVMQSITRRLAQMNSPHRLQAATVFGPNGQFRRGLFYITRDNPNNPTGVRLVLEAQPAS